MSKSVQLKNGTENYYAHPYFPVGSIYLSVVNTNPTKWFGGTWELVAKGRTLVGVDTADSDFSTVKKTGGEKKHTLTEDEMPSHSHDFWQPESGEKVTVIQTMVDLGKGNVWGNEFTNTNGYGSIRQPYNIHLKGGGQAHNNLQPYYTCYIWCRTK